MLTRKDFEAVAAVLRRQMAPTEGTFAVRTKRRETITAVAHGLADVFAADNPRFERRKFLTACGVLDYGS